MVVEMFRHFYRYHMTENRTIWNTYVIALTAEQFTQPNAYAHGSIRDQILHLISVDDVWFSALQGLASIDPLPATAADDREHIRAYWDQVEQRMLGYLAQLDEAMLGTQPITEPAEDRGLFVWQVLLHVVNHATDHRAQVLRSLHDLGITTGAQDYIFYVYDHPA